MPRTTPRRAVLVFAAALFAAPFAAADEVKLSGIPVPDVTIQTIQDGVLVYTTATGGQISKPLAEVEGIKLSRYQAIEEAAAAVEAGDHAKAVRLLQDVRRKGRPEWVSLYAAKKLGEAHLAARQTPEAVQVYVDLVLQGAHESFHPAVPLDAVENATYQQKQRIHAIVQPVIGRVSGPAAATLQQMAELSKTQIATVEPGASATPAPTPTAAADAAAATTDPNVGSKVTLPRSLSGHPVVEMLRRGEFQPARDTMARELLSSGQMSEKLYLHGMALVGLADQTGDEKLYKDAGLSFMRVVVHFGERTRLLGPALVEAGYVHQKIGREDLAQKLFEKARLQIDEADEPAYFARLQKLSNGQ